MRGPMCGPSRSAIQPLSGVAQVSSATKIVNAIWISETAQSCAFCKGRTNTDQPYCRLAIMIMQTTPKIKCRQRSLLRTVLA